MASISNIEQERAEFVATIGDKITAKVHADLAEGKTPAQIRAEAAKVLVSLGAGIKDEFNNMIATEGYKCRWRIKAVKMTRIHILLDNPNAAKDPSDRNLIQWCRGNFELRDKVLYKLPEKDGEPAKRVLWPSEVFDTIARVHLKLIHAGRDKIWPEINKQYHGLNKEECQWVIDHCAYCIANKATTTKAPLEPIVVDEIWKRVQIDLVDMRHEPSGRYKWILHIKDHFSKFTFLFPLVSKHR
jgi:hypothetical protein